MPVNLSAPQATALLPIDGVKLGYTKAKIRRTDRKDMLVLTLAEGASVSGVFTQNRFCAAPVTVCKTHLSGDKGIRAMVVNTGNANAGTGAQGMQDALTTCQAVAKALDIDAKQVLPFSTGVILEPLPMDRLLAGIPDAVAALQADNWLNAAEAIMTTDTIPKAVSKQIQLDGKTITITGMSKGSGMIHPNMATMLAYIATDAAVSQSALDKITQHAVRQSFNSITVDGDTSTNDSFMMMATHQAGNALIEENSDDYIALQQVLTEVAITLAQAIIRDGEGATKFISVQVESGRNEQECRDVAYAVARSPLVKTAFFASDPNLGRILAAIGYAGIDDLDVNQIDLYLGDILVATHGGRAVSYEEADGVRVMAQDEIVVRVVLNRGEASATIWTCDFSYDYVKINADYRT